MLDNLREDTRRLREIKTKPFPWYVIESLLFETGYQAVVLHRIAHWFKTHGIPVLGPLFARLNQFYTGVDIGPGAEIGPGLRIAHAVRRISRIPTRFCCHKLWTGTVALPDRPIACGAEPSK